MEKTNVHQANASVANGDEIRFFEIKAMGRWAWQGCRWMSGFATEADARQACELLGQADPVKSLKMGKHNREIAQQVEKLAGQGWNR